MHPFNYDPVEVAERKQILTDIADSLISSGKLPDDQVCFRLGRMQILVDGYFILNHAYKNWKLQDNHLTLETKIAALTCMSIMTVQPFRPIEYVSNTTAQAKCNEIFAITCASFISGKTIRADARLSGNLIMRIADILTESRSDTLEQFLVDRAFELPRAANTYDLEMREKDKLPLNALISIFELLPSRPVRVASTPPIAG